MPQDPPAYREGNKQATAGNLIAQLNPVIRGWANSHRHVVSKAICIKVDNSDLSYVVVLGHTEASEAIWPLVAQTYFQTRQGRQWTFVGTRVGHRGPPQERTLCRAGDVPIQRHGKIKGAANPYDPQWDKCTSKHA